MTVRATIKTLLKVLGAIVLAAALAIAAVLGVAAYAGYSAEQAARKFCADVTIGSEVDSVIARAREEGARHRGPRTMDGREVHDFEFQGWVFNIAVCRADVASGKVTALESILEGD